MLLLLPGFYAGSETGRLLEDTLVVCDVELIPRFDLAYFSRHLYSINLDIIRKTVSHPSIPHRGPPCNRSLAGGDAFCDPVQTPPSPALWDIR